MAMNLERNLAATSKMDLFGSSKIALAKNESKGKYYLWMNSIWINSYEKGKFNKVTGVVQMLSNGIIRIEICYQSYAQYHNQ
jgi:hypothetical protein